MNRVVLLALCVLVVGSSAPSAVASVRWFRSPSGNIGCELASADVRGTYAYCQTYTTPKSVRLSAHGRTTMCSGTRCVGDGPENAFTLAYGHSTGVGVFTCTSLLRGMRCVAKPSGHGFLISRDRLVRF